MEFLNIFCIVWEIDNPKKGRKMRLIGFGVVVAVVVSTQSFAKENKLSDTVNNSPSHSCAEIKKSDVLVRRDGVYAKINVIMGNGKEKIFYMETDKENKKASLMIDGKRHEIEYKGKYIYNIHEDCLK
ncbi:hypothetical protein [Acetobacter cibinongensis]|nr:hypothetical protein [Acetobacter cibinongensis]